jgi:hypothetical protein
LKPTKSNYYRLSKITKFNRDEIKILREVYLSKFNISPDEQDLTKFDHLHISKKEFVQMLQTILSNHHKTINYESNFDVEAIEAIFKMYDSD